MRHKRVMLYRLQAPHVNVRSAFALSTAFFQEDHYHGKNSLELILGSGWVKIPARTCGRTQLFEKPFNRRCSDVNDASQYVGLESYPQKVSPYVLCQPIGSL